MRCHPRFFSMSAGPLCIVMAVTANPLLVAAAAGAEPPSVAARRHLERARMHLKFGIVEHGNLAEFDAAENELAAAATRPELTADIRALQREAQRLREAARLSFDGRFPLVRAIDAGRQKSDSGYSPPSSLPEMAPRLAIRAALAQVAKELPSDLIDTVVLVYPNRLGEAPSGECIEWIQSEASSELGSLANVTLRSEILGAESIETPAWDAADAELSTISRAVLASLGEAAHPRNLALVMVRAVSPLPTDEYWFQAQCRVFDSSALAAIGDAAKFAASSLHVGDGLCRDASGWRAPLVACQAMLLLLAAASYALLLMAKRQVVSAWHDWLVPPLVGYALGIALPHAVASVMQGFLPPVGAAWLTSFWWPSLAGAFLLLLPSVVFRVGARSLAVVAGARRLDGRWGAALVAVALGVGAYWCEPALVYLGRESPTVLVPLILGGALLSYSFGRAIDPGDRFPLGTAPLAIALTLPFGAGTFMASPALLGGCCLAILALTLVAARRAATPSQSPEKTAAASRTDDGHAPRNLDDLRVRIQTGFYVPRGALERARQLCSVDNGRRTRWLGVCGPTGSGKTALVERVIADLTRGDNQARVLIGNCRAQSAPYQPFRDALADVWESVAPSSVQPEAASIDSVFHELAGLFVPYWDVLSVVADPAKHAATSPSDLNAAVALVLGRLAKKQRVVLFIDNVQWLDEGSASLVRHLYRQFAPGGLAGLTVILAARERAALEQLGTEISLLPLSPPSRHEQIAVLEEVLDFDPASARAIVKSLGSVADEPGGIFWLSRTIGQLLDQNAIDPAENGFALRADFVEPGTLPLPSDLRDALAARLHESADDQIVVQCAALLGHVFRVSVLAASLRKDRLELLQVLERLERQSRVFEDVIEKDDEYAFSSPFMYQVVREVLELGGDEASQAKPRKIVMELYAHIARALERLDTQTPTTVFDLAEHYHQAGSLYSAKALDYALAAARAARSQFAYRLARRYLAMAAASARAAGEPCDEERESLLIDCDEAHVTGRQRTAVAERGWQFVEGRRAVDNEMLLAMSRTCYDAGRDSGSAHWFDKAAELARRVLGTSSMDIERAEACHLLGISLTLDRRAERVAQLRNGLEIVEGLAASRAASLLKARLLGSLAEQLSYGTAGEREEARSLFECGLELRITGQLGDLPGQARAHGGLGRLAFFSDPPDYDAARRHLLADLQIAQTIDDVAGQSIAHNFLGKCDLATGNSAGALVHFMAAREHAQSTKDAIFALAGMLECSLLLDRPAEADRAGEELAKLAGSTTVPADCAEEISRVLKAAGEPTRPWSRLLADYVAITNP